MKTIIPNEKERESFIKAHLKKWATIRAIIKETAATARPITLYQALADYNARVR